MTNPTTSSPNPSSSSFSLDYFRLPQNFSEMVPVKKHIINIPVQKPKRQDFIRTYEDKSFWFSTALLHLERDGNRLGLRRNSLHADLLKQRSDLAGIEFRYLMQADFILFIRAELAMPHLHDRWWAETLPYMDRHHGSLELFARAVSQKYFDKIKVLLNIQHPEDLDALLASYTEGKRRLPSWGPFSSISPTILMGRPLLATLP